MELQSTGSCFYYESETGPHAVPLKKRLKPKPSTSLHVLDEERAVPWGPRSLLAWHLARYEFALPLAANGRVLDVGSGEGYGAALLAGVAKSVLGVDYAPVAVDHAAHTYARSNLSFTKIDFTVPDERRGLAGAAFDVITCFEVIEHVRDHEDFATAVASMLRGGGTLILSTPNTLVGRLPVDDGAYHVHLLTPWQLRRVLTTHFKVRLYGQVRCDRIGRETLKSIDMFNLRRYLRRSRSANQFLSTNFAPAQPDDEPPSSFRFGRRFVPQAQHTVAVATRR
jgi:2-polyprenyl-3-methyl-5-hydroxy-6-metoxy-1,4-benzoquinol methylase